MFYSAAGCRRSIEEMVRSRPAGHLHLLVRLVHFSLVLLCLPVRILFDMYMPLCDSPLPLALLHLTCRGELEYASHLCWREEDVYLRRSPGRACELTWQSGCSFPADVEQARRQHAGVYP